MSGGADDCGNLVGCLVQLGISDLAIGVTKISRNLRRHTTRNRLDLRRATRFRRNLGDNGRWLPDHQFEFHLANANLITRLEDHFATQRFTVHTGSVGATQISEANGIVVDGKDAVMAADHVAVRPQMTVLLTPDQELFGREGNGFPLMFSAQNLEFRL